MDILEREQKTPSKISLNIHPALKKIYAVRGIITDDDLSLELRDLERPSSLLNIDQAVSLLINSLQNNARIIIVGDFDADGATSSALAMLCLRAMGFTDVHYLVPNRFQFGYGLTPEIVEVANEKKPDLIITVDNGISSVDGVKLARDLGIDVLVTDHHLAGEFLPEANCILNPNQPGCSFPSKALAGVGVVFYLMTALRAKLRQLNWFIEQGIKQPNMASYLDIVALGTVADVVPLDKNNRRLVKHGLNIIRSGKGRVGITALLEVGGRNHQRAIASDLGFSAGPRLNAAGRLDDMSLGIECLLTEDKGQAHKIAQQLDDLNKDRKVIEQEMQTQALDSLQAINYEAGSDQLGICLYDENWHQGVIGILASRMKDKFHRPSIIFADAGEHMIKGSARSIQGLHIRDLLDGVAAHNPRLLSKFGGHAMAAGLAIKKADFEEFVAAYEYELSQMLDPELLQQQTLTDGTLHTECFNLEFAEQLRHAGPWGQSFPEPLFSDSFAVLSYRVLGNKHLKMVLQVPQTESCVDAIAFNVEDSLLTVTPEQVKITYRLDVNEFRGVCSPQLMIEDIEAS